MNENWSTEAEKNIFMTQCFRVHVMDSEIHRPIFTHSSCHHIISPASTAIERRDFVAFFDIFV